MSDDQSTPSPAPELTAAGMTHHGDGRWSMPGVSKRFDTRHGREILALLQAACSAGDLLERPATTLVEAAEVIRSLRNELMARGGCKASVGHLSAALVNLDGPIKDQPDV